MTGDAIPNVSVRKKYDVANYQYLKNGNTQHNFSDIINTAFIYMCAKFLLHILNVTKVMNHLEDINENVTTIIVKTVGALCVGLFTLGPHSSSTMLNPPFFELQNIFYFGGYLL